jgi:hypothetical protein
VLPLLGTLGFGCVNDYVVDETLGDGSGSAGDTSGATTESDPDSTACVTNDCMATGGGEGSGDGAASTGPGTTGGPGLCGTCASDAECVDMYGLCVMLGDAGRCLVPCTEQEPPCPDGYTCMAVESVDGASAQQCAPVGGACGGS